MEKLKAKCKCNTTFMVTKKLLKSGFSCPKCSNKVNFRNRTEKFSFLSFFTMIFIYLFSFACLLLSIDFFLQIYAESNGKERDFQTKVIIAKIYAEYNNYGSYSSEQKTSYPEKKTHYSDVHLTENQKNNKSNKQKTSFSQRKNTSQNFNADLTQEKKNSKSNEQKTSFSQPKNKNQGETYPNIHLAEKSDKQTNDNWWFNSSNSSTYESSATTNYGDTHWSDRVDWEKCIELGIRVIFEGYHEYSKYNEKVHVNAYTDKNGRYVPEHYRSYPNRK